MGAPQAQAESVAEAVVRHQDIGERGKMTALTGILQLGTVFGGLLNFPFTFFSFFLTLSMVVCGDYADTTLLLWVFR